MSKKIFALILTAIIVVTVGCSNKKFNKDVSSSKNMVSGKNIDKKPIYNYEATKKLNKVTKLKDSINVLKSMDKDLSKDKIIDKNQLVNEIKSIVNRDELTVKNNKDNKIKVTNRENCKNNKKNIKDNKKGSINKNNYKQHIVNPSYENMVINKVGNSFENICNKGLVTKQGDWIFYSQNMEFEKSLPVCGLYKMRDNGSQEVKLLKGFYNNLNVIGEWIYCYSFDDEALIKVKTDGKYKSIIKKQYIYSFNIIDKKIYYVTNNGLYNMNIDGSNNKEILQGNIDNVFWDKEYIYYINKDTCRIHKVKNNGSDDRVLINKRTVDMKQCGKYIFFINDLEDEYPKLGDRMLYRINLDGSGLKNIDRRNVHSFNIDKNYVYVYGLDYSINDGTPAIYRINQDGTNIKKISNKGGIMDLNIAGDWLYYNDFSLLRNNIDKLCRMKIDGTNDQILN